MAEHKINIRIGADGGKAVSEFAKVGKASTDLAVSVKKMGNMFGEIGGNIGGFLQNFLKGGVWGMAQAAIATFFSVLKKWCNEAKEVAEESAKAVEKSFADMTSAIEAYKVAVGDVAKAEREAVDAALSARKSELGITERLTKATIELARQKRIAAGEDAQTVNAESDAAAMEASAKSSLEKSDAEINAIRKRLDSAENERDNAWEEVNRLRDAKGELYGAKWFDSEGVKKSARALDRAVSKKIEDARNVAFGAEARIEKEEAALAAALREREALEMEIEAGKLRAANDRAEKEQSAAKAAAEAASKAEIEAQKNAAKERERLDRELHAKRMADLRAEIAAQKEAATPLRAVAAQAQTEFERAFAMYRDPSRAAAEIGEEKDRAEDLKRLHNDANRSGSRWRVAELSQLMAAGDSQGVQSRLEEWRKSSKFTPEVEAMVRAAAAERTKTTVEDELRKIETNTSGLAQKLDELLKMKE